jgi:hypothetical protein
MSKAPFSLRLSHARAVLCGDYQHARYIEGQILMSQLSDAFTAAQNAVASLQSAVTNVQTYTGTLQADSADAATVAAGLGTLTDNITSAATTLNGLVPAPAAPTVDPTTGLPTA